MVNRDSLQVRNMPRRPLQANLAAGFVAKSALIRWPATLLISFIVFCQAPEVQAQEMTPSELRISRNRAELREDRLSVERKSGLVFAEHDQTQLKLDVYRPANDKVYPAVLVIHGGAWMSGSKTHWLRHGNRLASHGFVVVAINYRLAPKSKFPAQMEDVRDALAWIGNHSTEFGIDVDHVAAYGYSAGAQLALLWATTQNDPSVSWSRNRNEPATGPATGAANSGNPLPTIMAVAAGGSPADFDWIDPRSDSLKYWLGATKQSAPELYRLASPRDQLDEGDRCAFFIYHGTEDGMVPIEAARRFDRDARRRKLRTKFVELPDSGHVTAFLNTVIVDEIADFFDAAFADRDPERD
jgi:triacylglycerol lipase